MDPKGLLSEQVKQRGEIASEIWVHEQEVRSPEYYSDFAQRPPVNPSIGQQRTLPIHVRLKDRTVRLPETLLRGKKAGEQTLQRLHDRQS